MLLNFFTNNWCIYIRASDSILLLIIIYIFRICFKSANKQLVESSAMKELHFLLGLFLLLSIGDCFQNMSAPYNAGRTSRSVTKSIGIPSHVLRRFRPSYYRPNKQKSNYKLKRQNFAKAALEAHNNKRRTSPHYGSKLVLDAKLCRGAQRYAEKLAKRNSGLQPSRIRGLGENLHHHKGRGKVVL